MNGKVVKFHMVPKISHHIGTMEFYFGTHKSNISKPASCFAVFSTQPTRGQLTSPQRRNSRCDVFDAPKAWIAGLPKRHVVATAVLQVLGLLSRGMQA